MADSWYYVENGEKQGPVSQSKLGKYINRDTLVWTEGMDDWIQASDVSELEEVINKKPPPVPGGEPPPISATSEQKKPKYHSRIVDSVVYAYVLVGLLFLETFLYESGASQGMFYRFVLFATALSYLRVYWGIKSYLNHVLKFMKANININ